jgi:hypothetical protein
MKRYELHYQPKKMTIDRAEVLAQCGSINFHGKCSRSQGAKLTVVVKNKWSRGWMHARFYYMVPLLQSSSPLQGKSVYLAFVHAASLIGGQDVVEEYLACGMFPLSASFRFSEIADRGETSFKSDSAPT